MTVKHHYQEVKTVIRKRRMPDDYFCSKYSFSPYCACQHGCVYCDGRAEKYYVEGDFTNDIVIRRNFPDILHRDLSKLRERGTIVIGSGVSDPYQPVESTELLMRRAAEILIDFSFSVSILTKSALILRDLDLWERIHKKQGVTLMISLVFTDESTRRIFEPGASSIEERWATLSAFKGKGINAGILAMPLLPFISDTSETISSIAERARSLKLDFILPSSLTLRPSTQKDTFMKTLNERFPQLVPKYQELYAENRPSGAATFAYREQFYSRIVKLIIQHSLNLQVPHYVYQGRMANYDELLILLHHLLNLYHDRTNDLHRLRESIALYEEWISKERQHYMRRHNLPKDFLEVRFRSALIDGTLAAVLRNDKLLTFLQRVVIEGMTFNYQTLKLSDRQHQAS